MAATPKLHMVSTPVIGTQLCKRAINGPTASTTAYNLDGKAELGILAYDQNCSNLLGVGTTGRVPGDWLHLEMDAVKCSHIEHNIPMILRRATGAADKTSPCPTSRSPTTLRHRSSPCSAVTSQHMLVMAMHPTTWTNPTLARPRRANRVL